MDGFTIVDWIVAGLIVLSALLAYSRGLMREIMSIAGWIVAALAGFLLVDQAQPLVRQIPVVGDVIGDTCELSVVASFGVVFVIALVIVSLFTPLLGALIQRSALGGVDQALGFVFGVLRGILLVAIGFFLYNTIITSQDVAAIDQSRSAAIFGRYTDDIEDQDPEQALGWVTARYEELIGTCDS
ncbi:MAG: CvpA family protein [Pseudomonadota bacterium]